MPIKIKIKPWPIARMTGKSQQKEKTVQSIISSSFSDSRISKGRQSSLAETLLKLMVGKVLPLSRIDNRLFQTFVNLIDPRYIKY